MRPSQIRLVAAAGVLAAAIGVSTAFVVGRDGASPVSPAAIADTTTTSTTAVATDPSPAPAPKPKPNPAPEPPADRDARAAKAAAVSFLRELGMRDPVAASYRKTGPVTAEAGLHPRAGEGGRRLDQVTTLVQLHRYRDGWVATGASAVNTIEVDQPLPFSRIASPVTVSGLSVAYEGTVHVSVLQDRRGADRVLGKGFVNGGATELAPFSGSIRFADPANGIAGWVVFSGDTGADTGIMSATAVRVRFIDSDHVPQILGVTTTPAPTGSAKLVTLRGTGTLTVNVKAFAADEVRVLLVPSGTGARPHARLLGVDTSSEDGERWSVSWRYPDESFNGHLLIQVNGRGGTAEHDGVAVLHE
jgi:Immunoglobulin-like domain of bacterial spore germination